MRSADTLRSAFRVLRGNKLRSGLTTLGIVIGVASVVVMVAIGAGTQAEIREEVERLGPKVVTITSAHGQVQGIRQGAGSHPTLSDDDAVAVQESASEVLITAPMVLGTATIIYGNQNWQMGLQGVTESIFVARDRSLSTGRLLDDWDVANNSKVIVLGATTARMLFGDLDPVGQRVRVNQLPMEVIGVLQQKGQTLDGSDLDDVAFVPLSTARDQLLGRSFVRNRAVSMITAKVADERRIPEAIEQIRQILRFEHRLGPGRPDDFRISNLAESARLQEQSSAAMTQLLAAIASVSLLVGGIGIMNIMLVSVTERTREIGVRMAIGAKPQTILKQFLTEATILSIAGGLAGAVIGFAGAIIAETQFGMRVELTADPVVLAFIFSALVGLVFGLYPAMRAARMSPLEALRYE